jgi:excisionase family DNA binding protein
MHTPRNCLTYTVEEAGQLLGIGRNQAYDGVKSGEIPSIRVGKRVLIPKALFDKLLNGEIHSALTK